MQHPEWPEVYQGKKCYRSVYEPMLKICWAIFIDYLKRIEEIFRILIANRYESCLNAVKGKVYIGVIFPVWPSERMKKH